MAGQLKFPVPDKFRRGVFGGRRLVETGRTIVDYFLEAAGLTDLRGLDVLDYGCGHRMAQVLAEYDLEYGSYTGVDIEPELISYLDENRPDARMRFVLAPFANELYRPAGAPMHADSSLDIGDTQFDTAWLLSVFTHLDPDDSQALLHILNRYVRDDGTLFFSAFIDPLLEQPFVDKDADRPLLRALFSEDFMFSMLAKAGWEATYYRGPTEIIQSHFLCRKTDLPEPPRIKRIETDLSRRYGENVANRNRTPG